MGIFLFYATLLFKVFNFNIKTIYYLKNEDLNDEIKKTLPAILIQPYKEKYYYFELFELFRKLFMTSLSIFFIEGSAIQLFFTLIGALLFLVLTLNIKPYKSYDANVLQVVSLCCLVIVVAIGLVNRLDINQFDQRYYNPIIFDIMLMIATFLPIILSILQTIYKTILEILNFCSKKKKDENNINTKIIASKSIENIKS